MTDPRFPESRPPLAGPTSSQPVYKGLRPPGVSRPELVSFARRVVVAVLIALLLVALGGILYRGMHVLLETFAGILFAVFLGTLSKWLSQHTRLSYGWALTLVVLVFLFVVAGLGWLLANRVAGQMEAMQQKLPQSLDKVREFLNQHAWGKLLAENFPRDQAAWASLVQFARITDVVTGLMDFLVAGVIIFFVGVFGAAEPDLYREGLLHLVPPRQRPRAAEAVDAVVFNLRWWLVGQVALMVIIGVTTFVGLLLLRIPLALTLGVIAGIMELVPYLGPWISAVPAALLALLVSPGHVVAVLGLYLFLHLLEGYVLLPLIQRRSVKLPPALTLFGQALLGKLLGLMGLFVAAPLTVAGVVLLKMLYVEDTLGDEEVDVPGEPGNEEKPAAQENKESVINQERPG